MLARMFSSLSRRFRAPSAYEALAIALAFVALGGSSIAAPVRDAASRLITGKQVKNGSLSEKDLSAAARAKLKGRAGPQGPQGASGPQGNPGAKGDKGDTGGVDTSNYYDKAASDSRFLSTSGKSADSDLLDGMNSTAFLGATAKASDSDKLDGLDSTELKSDRCGAGYVLVGGMCWEDPDANNLTLTQASARCRSQGGRLPLLSEFMGLMTSGVALTVSVQLDWTANSAGNDNSIYIDSTDATNPDGVRANTTSSFGRCIKPPLNALGSP
jgi:hypothetical protein